jgi:mRNA-degrading endonuclease RelE of RelBE toxin-antitoxin system
MTMGNLIEVAEAVLVSNDLPRRIESGYHVARMRFEIVLAPEAVQRLRKLPAHIRSAVRDALEKHRRHEPTKVSKSRIKRLRGLSQPQYRLRIDDIRVFYDVTETTVEILAIVTKDEAEGWLGDEGTPAQGGGTR